MNFRDQGVGSSSGSAGILSRLFQTILHDLNINGPRWKYLLDKYVDREVSNFDNRRDRTSIRGNLNKELTRRRMSWKVFCKAMQFLDFVGFEIQIHAKHRSGQVTIHSTVVDWTTPLQPQFDLENPEEGDGRINRKAGISEQTRELFKDALETAKHGVQASLFEEDKEQQ